MTEKRFLLKENGIIDDTQLNIILDGGCDKEDMVDLLNELNEENIELKQYKQAVSDVLLLYSQKNLSAKQLGLLTAIMHELGVLE